MKKAGRVSWPGRVAVAAMIAFPLVNCGADAPTNAGLDVEPGRSIGELHNAALAHALDALQDGVNKGEIRSPDDMLPVIHRSINDWAQPEGVRFLPESKTGHVHHSR